MSYNRLYLNQTTEGWDSGVQSTDFSRALLAPQKPD